MPIFVEVTGQGSSNKAVIWYDTSCSQCGGTIFPGQTGHFDDDWVFKHVTTLAGSYNKAIVRGGYLCDRCVKK